MTPNEQKQELLDKLYSSYTKTMPCHLDFCDRNNIVFGEGNPNAKLILVGEAPGREEDKQGRPFVGRSGKLLDKVLAKAGIDRSEVYITNVVKCRPPNNRTPSPREISICTERFLYNQINIIKPKIIATLGSVAGRAMLHEPIQITKIHGQVFNINNITIVPVYHPAYILRNMGLATAWLTDFEIIKKLIEQK